MEYFLELVGNQTIRWAVLVIGTAIFLRGCYKIVEKYFSDKTKREIEKEKQFQDVVAQVKQYPEWHQQSLNIQKQFTDSINELKSAQQEHSEKLQKIEKDSMRRERNKLQDRLLQSYRYYTSMEKNPLQAWSKMEADAFWNIFKDYEDALGDGYMHTVVQPAMRMLETIPMHETERLAELMKNRK